MIERFPTLSARWTALSPRERIFVAVGGALVLLFLLYMLAPSGSDADVELADDMPPEAPPAFAPPPAPAPVAAAPAGPAPASTQGLVLYGVLGGGPGGGAAIIGMPGGGQRAVPVGRQFLPGLTLKGVGLAHAVISTSGGDYRLEFNKGAEAVASAPAQGSPAGEGAQQRQRETLQFREGLEKQTSDGRVIGYAVKPGADMPLLARAGLRPGDVIVRVNNQAIRSGEKVSELSYELSTAYTAKIEFLRNGRPMTANLEMNKPPGS